MSLYLNRRHSRKYRWEKGNRLRWQLIAKFPKKKKKKHVPTKNVPTIDSGNDLENVPRIDPGNVLENVPRIDDLEKIHEFVTSFPGRSRLQSLIACRMQKVWEIESRA